MLSACSSRNNQGADTAAQVSGNESGDDTSGSKKYEELITVDVFSHLANYQGIATGWWADIVKEKFNMELNIISPNVSGGGDTLYYTRTAGGDLGDLVIVGAENGRMQELVTAGLIIDMADYVADTEYLNQYTEAIENINTLVEEEGVYGIPLKVSSQSASTASEGIEPTFGPYLRWDLYAELGYPEINSLSDLLDVLEDMQNLNPETETGNKAYALSLFKDWDGNMMICAKQPACYYGYDEMGFVLARADGGDFQSIIEDDSMYVEVLEFFNEAYQRGLVDPESSTQTFDVLEQKYRDGEVLFSFWPWMGQSYYNTTERMEEGKGFMIADITDMQIFSYGCNPLGDKTFIGVGSQAEDPERLMDFIEWMYSPEGVTLLSASQCGPKGLTWEMVDGEPVITEFGVLALINDSADMPEGWGDGNYRDGMSQLNITTVMETDINPDTGYPYYYLLWDSYQETYMTTALHQDWQEHMGAMTAMDYLKENDKLLTAPGSGYITPDQSAEIETIRGQVKSNIVSYSWQMVYANDDSEFSTLLSEMQTTVLGLGYEDVLTWDMQCAQDQETARAAVRE